MTPQVLSRVLGIPLSRATAWHPHIEAALALAECNTTQRIACFLAQVGHESGRLRYVKELWGPTAAQVRYERNFSAPWPKTTTEARKAAYKVNRLAYGLGNYRSGFGKRYMGHGLIQITGYANHVAVTVGLRKLLPEAKVPDFALAPELLALPTWAALSAAWFWRNRGLNQFSDSGDFRTQTRRINGGYNGFADREAIRVSALNSLKG